MRKIITLKLKIKIRTQILDIRKIKSHFLRKIQL